MPGRSFLSMDLSRAGYSPAGDFFKVIEIAPHQYVIGVEVFLCDFPPDGCPLVGDLLCIDVEPPSGDRSVTYWALPPTRVLWSLMYGEVARSTKITVPTFVLWYRPIGMPSFQSAIPFQNSIFFPNLCTPFLHR